MKLLLEKWYLDFSSHQGVGFYYIMRVTLGPFRFGFSGINHFIGSRKLQSFRISRIKHSGIHTLDLGHARLTLKQGDSELFIRHGKLSLMGRWRSSKPSSLRPARPLYANAHGRCDWKVWCPRADVRLKLQIKEQESWVQGTGYIDFVRISFPVGKVPFRRLYWGRMHSENSWAVFLALQTSEKNISWCLTPGMAVENVEVRLNRDSRGHALHMDWLASGSGPETSIRCRIIRLLESQEVLNRGRLLNVLPPAVRRRLSSGGRDEKYAVDAKAGGQLWHGIMEEVRWHVS